MASVVLRTCFRTLPKFRGTVYIGASGGTAGLEPYSQRQPTSGVRRIEISTTFAICPPVDVAATCQCAVLKRVGICENNELAGKQSVVLTCSHGSFVLRPSFHKSRDAKFGRIAKAIQTGEIRFKAHTQDLGFSCSIVMQKLLSEESCRQAECLQKDSVHKEAVRQAVMCLIATT